MNKILKKAIMLICISAIAIPCVSCGSKESTPEEALKTYIDSYKRVKDVKYDNVGEKKEDILKLVDKRDYNLTMILTIMNANKGDKDFWHGIYEDLGKVEVEIKNVDVKDDKASVEISSNAIDLDKINSNAYTNTKKRAQEKQDGDKKAKELYMDCVKEELANEPSTQKKVCTINLEKNSEGKWSLASDSVGELENAITSYKNYKVYESDLTDEFKEILKNL